jgi:hypothetical protein
MTRCDLTPAECELWHDFTHSVCNLDQGILNFVHNYWHFILMAIELGILISGLQQLNHYIKGIACNFSSFSEFTRVLKAYLKQKLRI